MANKTKKDLILKIAGFTGYEFKRIRKLEKLSIRDLKTMVTDFTVVAEYSHHIRDLVNQAKARARKAETFDV